MLLYAMVCGTVPFKAPNMEDLHKLIKKGEFAYPNDLTDDAKKLIEGCITLDPFKRLTLPQILAHEWLKETNDDSEESEEETESKNATPGPSAPDDKTKTDGKSKQEESKDEDIDLKAISGNINFVNVDNLFYQENYGVKLSYTDY